MVYSSFEQRKLNDDITNQFKSYPEVFAIIQRGSFAKGCEDRASDIDVLFVIEDESFEQFLYDLNKRLGETCTLLVKEGWIDSIVPDFGGMGLVFLVKKFEKLMQVDIYVTPVSRAKRIWEFKEKQFIYQRGKHLPDINDNLSTSSIDVLGVVERYSSTRSVQFQAIFEVFLMIEMYAKHIYRGHVTLAAKYRYQLSESVATLIRLAYTPNKVDYKMYDWEKDFTNVSTPIVKKFERSLTLVDIFSENQLISYLRLIDALLHETSLKEYCLEFNQISNEVKTYINTLLSPDYPA